MRNPGVLSAAVVVVAVLAWSGSAQAQQNYVVTQSSQPYSALTGATVATLAPSSSWDPHDEGYLVVPLGFSFPYYGNTYTEVLLHSNGIITFPPHSPCNGSGINCGGVDILSTATPNGFIAPWNADMDGSAAGSVNYISTPSEMTIEYKNWGYFTSSCTGSQFSFQLKLNASGLFQVHYGTHTGTCTATTSGAGWEDPTGTAGGGLPSCGAGRTCTSATFPTNTLFTVGQPQDADLYVEQVAVVSTTPAPTAQDLTIEIQPTFRNFGLTAANNFHWKAYLSTSKTSLTGATLFFDSATAAPADGGGTVSVAPTTTFQPATPGKGVVTNVAPGNYYVLVEADTTNVVTEFSETNNVGATLNYFTQGFDLVATAVSGPVQSGPGNPITVNLSWFNQGTSAASGPVEFRLYLSADTVLDASDFPIHEWVEQAIAGSQTANNVTQSFTVPGNVPGGDWHWILAVNTGSSAPAEATNTNNTVASSAKTEMLQAELEMVSVELLNPATLQPIREAFLGEQARVRARFKNVGGANANNFHIGAALSKDSSLSLVPGGDFYFHDEPGFSASAGGSEIEVSFNVTIPLVDKQGNALQTGSYFIYAVLDSYGVITEVANNKGNNYRPVGATDAEPINLRAPAPDYAVIKIEVPAAAAVGEVMPLYRVIKNVGNAVGPMVSYRYFASANDLVTSSDIALPILSSTGAVLDAGEVELAEGQSDARTDLVQLPGTLIPGSWFIGVVVDVGNVVVEHDEANNSAGAPMPVQVVASTLTIANQQVPDATVGMPFEFKLGVGSTQETLTWSVPDGGLPPGLSLSPAGVLSGTATATGIYTFTVVVENGNTAAAARLVMRVLSPSPELAILTATLPPAINSTTLHYSANLAAVGGTMPYTWSLTSGALPNGLTLAEDGTVEGMLKPGVPFGETPLQVEVADALGNRTSAQVRIKVVEPGALVIQTLTLPETMVNAEYVVDLTARNMDQSMLAKPLSWTVASGRLPEGMALTVAQDELGLITGKPVEAGTYTFALQVTDAKGRSDVSDFILRVHPARMKLSAVNPPQTLRPGDEVAFQITTGNDQSRYRIYSGALPPGLTMDEAGQVTGVVETEENALGTWNFVVEARSAAAGSSLGAFSLQVVPHPVSTGCSAAPGAGGAGWLMFAAPLLALFGRRRALKAVAAVGAVALAVLPAQALAQTFNYSVAGPSTAPYQTLSGGTTITNSLTTSAGMNNVSLPFPFEFYGEAKTSLGISLHGYVAFDGLLGSGSNVAIPHNSSTSTVPKSFIAPWWDTLNKTTSSPATVVKYGTIGAAPNRKFVVDWQNVCPTSTCSSNTRVSFQLQLSEGSNVIRFAYGPSSGSYSGSASTGIQRQATVGSSGLSCGATCGQSQFISNTAMDFRPLADLLIQALSVDDTGYAGVQMPSAAIVANNGGVDATGVTVAYYLSQDTVLDAGTDIPLGTSNSATVPAGGTATVSGNLTVPAGTAQGPYFLLSEIQTTVPQNFTGNDRGVPMPFTVGGPTPDLEIQAISSTPSTAAPGGTLTVSRTLGNRGNAASAPFTVTYFVSNNSVVSISDTAIHTEQVAAISAGGTNADQVMIPLPANMFAGKYWIGACADYDHAANPTSTVTEISEVNNCATGNEFTLDTGELAITTTTLPEATQNSPYGQQLEVIGGDGTYSWEGIGLPAGLTLSTSGTLAGSPSQAGSFSFTVKVSSSTQEKTRQLNLTVVDRNLPLAIADHQLPSAEFGKSYAVQLVAVGGNPGYLWTLAQGSRLPVGLNLSPDGFIEGRTTETSAVAIPFTVEVEDQDGTRAAKDLQILVSQQGGLQIATTKLPTGYVEDGAFFNAQLRAVGGSGTYGWSIIKFQQLAQTPTEIPGEVQNKLPDNFGLTLQGSALAGQPKVAGLFAVTIRVADVGQGTGAEDITTLPLHISYKKPLVVTTSALPDAFSGRPYQVRLSHNSGADATVRWKVTCVQQAQPTAQGITYSCLPGDANQKLPDGLALAEDGSITGTPSEVVAAPAEGAAPSYPVYSFLVEAEDERGRKDVRSLSIRVQPTPEEGGGCSGTGMGPAALALMGLAGLWRRRRAASQRQ